jgi:DNA-binding winged helix-turn-helix (wHTH) protein
MLARAGGATVSRDELITACWQGRIVSDDAVTRTIAKVRAVAKDVSPAPFVLETLPKVGYRLTAQDAAAAVAAETAAPASSEPASGHTASGKAAQWRPLILVAGLSVAVLAAWALLPRQSEAGLAPGVAACRRRRR